MNNEKKRIEKIYSRHNFKLPKVDFSNNKRLSLNNFKKGNCKTKKQNRSNNIRKVVKIGLILIIAFMVVYNAMNAIEPIIEKQCTEMAKSIATKISNEQATIVMEDYEYEDLCNITKDSEDNVKMLSLNIINVNKIISDVPIKIQEELEKEDNNKFYIKLGSFTGSKILSGRGPKVEIKMSSIGSLETDLKSEFIAAGINQTVHRVYLEVKCKVIILTPFQSIEEEIVNQVLIAEGVIVGNIPSTYYNIEGLEKENSLDLLE